MNFNEEHVLPISLLVYIQNDDIISRKNTWCGRKCIAKLFYFKV